MSWGSKREPAPPPPRRRSGLISFPLVATLAVAAGLLWVRNNMDESVDSVNKVIAFTQGWPPLPSDAATSRLLPKPAAPAGQGGYSFMVSTQLGPAAYDPCRPLHLVVNKENAPRGADDILADAVQLVMKASGLKIVIEGTTNEPTQLKRPVMDKARYGDRWSPALIAWTTPQRDPRLAGDVLGFGGSQAVADRTGRLWNVTGTVNLDGPGIGDVLRRHNGHALAAAIVAHELGHLLGLDHTSDQRQLMAPTSTGQTHFGNGDRRGFALLADVPCNTAF